MNCVIRHRSIVVQLSTETHFAKLRFPAQCSQSEDLVVSDGWYMLLKGGSHAGSLCSKNNNPRPAVKSRSVESDSIWCNFVDKSQIIPSILHRIPLFIWTEAVKCELDWNLFGLVRPEDRKCIIESLKIVRLRAGIVMGVKIEENRTIKSNPLLQRALIVL